MMIKVAEDTRSRIDEVNDAEADRLDDWRERGEDCSSVIQLCTFAPVPVPASSFFIISMKCTKKTQNCAQKQ